MAKAGRKTKEIAALSMIPVIHQLPEINRPIHVWENNVPGNRIRQHWQGVLKKSTSELYMLELHNGVKECFRVKDFLYGHLSFEYLEKK